MMGGLSQKKRPPIRITKGDYKKGTDLCIGEKVIEK
jgi:hypothetical protein